MRLLILGGTAWLGGEVAGAALRSGHSVTCLARGSAQRPPDGVYFVAADRADRGAYQQVADEHWDVVIDVSRQPGQVESAVSALLGCAERYVFISSGNVYADHRLPGQTEQGALLPALPGAVMTDMSDYGEAKVACEQHVLQGFGPRRALIARFGLIGGPGDESDRSGYWPLRFARPASDDGSVLVPADHDLPTQLIDVRDGADWLIAVAAQGLTGIFNVTGETNSLTDHLRIARTVAGHDGTLVTADRRWLLDHGVQEWMGERSLPLWLADADWQGFSANDSARARAAGLSLRPLAETLSDTLAWELGRDRDRPRRAGLSDGDEAALLVELAGERQTSA